MFFSAGWFLHWTTFCLHWSIFCFTEKCLFSKISFEKTPVDPELSQIYFPEFQSFREFLFFSKPIFHKTLFKKLVEDHFQTLQSVSEICSSTQFIKNKNWKKLKKKNLEKQFFGKCFFLNIHPNERLMECRGTNVLSTHFFKTFGKIKLTKKV